ncbi:hypothetical protein ACFWYW_46935 [Nonomuraea sp. NPDC059023]|uniref:hypothetical protein n=1 Tax=unclassified Nonomuraea TaxID=2593643 RepID=UPI0036C11A6B
MTEEPSRLPYPHTRNDCGMCRERDADFHLPEEIFSPPGKRPGRYCRQCVGEVLMVHAQYSRPRDADPDEPFTVTLVMLPPGRDTW